MLVECNLLVGSLRDREVAPSDRQGSNFKSCVWLEVSSHHLQEVLSLALHVICAQSGLNPYLIFFL